MAVGTGAAAFQDANPSSTRAHQTAALDICASALSTVNRQVAVLSTWNLARLKTVSVPLLVCADDFQLPACTLPSFLASASVRTFTSCHVNGLCNA